MKVKLNSALVTNPMLLMGVSIVLVILLIIVRAFYHYRSGRGGSDGKEMASNPVGKGSRNPSNEMYYGGGATKCYSCEAETRGLAYPAKCFDCESGMSSSINFSLGFKN